MAPTIINIDTHATLTEIATIINTASSGSTIVFPADQTYLVEKGLQIDVAQRSLTIDLNGSTLQQASNTSVIWAYGSHGPNQSASIDLGASNQTIVTVANATSYAVGTYIKVFSDDVLPNDQAGGSEPTRLGQAMKVVGVEGNKLVLEGDLLNGESYSTNIRVSSYSSGDLVLKNGTVRGDQMHPDWVADLVNVRSTVSATIDHLTVRDGNSMGVNIVDSVNTLVSDVVAKNLLDNTGAGQLGYAVHSAGSFNTTVVRLYAEEVRHATDSNAVGVSAGHANASKYGADIGMKTIDSIAYDTSAFSYSWHSETRESVIQHSLAFDSPGLIGARGVGNSMIDSYGVNTDRGIQLYEYGDGDAYDLLFDGVKVKDATVAAYTKVNNPHGNMIINSSFEVSKYAGVIGDAATLVNTTVISYLKNFNDIIAGSVANDVLLGGKGIDLITGGAGSDYIWGGLGDDILSGGEGRDFFAFHRMTDATDVVLDFQVGINSDVIDLSVLAKHYDWTSDKSQYVRFMTSGNDVLVQVDTDGGRDGFVNLVTLKNVSVSDMSMSAVLFDLGLGVNPVITVPASPIATPVEEELPSKGIWGSDLADKIVGTSLNDEMFGAKGDDRLTGEEGDDVLDGGAGADKLLGGAGSDTASYASTKQGVAANLADAKGYVGDAKGDTYSQIENLSGSSFDDELSGNRGVNVLNGGDGNDRINGDDGADTLYGGAGNDILFGGDKNDFINGGSGNDWIEGQQGIDNLYGGSGSDQFVFSSFSDRYDLVADFSSAEKDKIVFRSSEFNKIGNTFAEDSFILKVDNDVMTNANPHFIYNKATGALNFDANGNGKGAAVLIATFENHADLSYHDISFI